MRTVTEVDCYNLGTSTSYCGPAMLPTSRPVAIPVGRCNVVDSTALAGAVKRCSRCREIKPLRDYPCDARMSLGVSSWCRICHSEAERSYRRRYLRPWPEGIEEASDRLESKVDRSAGPDGCWPFMGSKDQKGYGRIRCGGESRLAHRVAFVLAGGDPQCEAVMHSCNNPACCNPDHLLDGTVIENNAYTVECERQARGDRLPQAKLTDEIVRDVLVQIDCGVPQRVIAAGLDVHQSSISNVVRGATWRHVSRGG